MAVNTDPARRRWLQAALAAAGCRPGPAHPQAQPHAAPPSGNTLAVGLPGGFPTFNAALRAAGDGDTIALQPGVYAGDVGVAVQRNLRIQGLGAGAVLQADGRHAEGKAILVVRGEVVVENIEFRGARVPGGNGAGIRFERGRLHVLRCRFLDNENGILTANESDMELDVVDSTFGAAPRHAGLLHHLLYVGAIGRLTLRGSRFHGGWRGHLVKVRARSSRIVANLIDDGPGGEASYELEFPNGGDHVVLGNVIGQSALSQNPTLVSMGAEAGGEQGSRLVLAHNTLLNRGSADAGFLAVWTGRLRGATQVHAANNLFIGPGAVPLGGGFDGGGNVRAAPEALRDVAGLDFRPAPSAAWRNAALPLPPDWTPADAFMLPAGTRRVAGPRRSPGAFEAG